MIQRAAEGAEQRTVFLAWQDKAITKEWFPVGQLDAVDDPVEYRFRYIGGAKRAQEEAGYPLPPDFPDIEGVYSSPRIFPIFRNRVISPNRPDFGEYMRILGLPDDPAPDPIEILAVSGGRRVTDSYEVFPKIVKREDGGFTCRFFLHGLRHVNPEARARVDSLQEGETLYAALELTNPATGLAVQIQTEDYHVIGWSPRYLVEDLAKAMADSPREYRARVARANPDSLYVNHRLLVEMDGRWDTREPMSGEDYEPLA